MTQLHTVIALKVRTGELDARSGQDVLAEFESDLAKRLYRMVPIGSAEYTVARDWLGRFSSPLRTLDALHLAAAAGNDAVLLTADSVLAQSAGHFKVKHRLMGGTSGQT
jgi:predicted nucleic acid-binding protein